MPDTKITALTAIGANPIIPSTFPIPMVDLTDTSMAASGTTKKVTVNQILGAGGTATLASATITGDLTVRTNRLATTTTGVGIGTASPIVPLDVRGGAGAGALFLRTTDPTAAVSSAYIQTPVSTGFSALVPIYGFWYQNCGMGNPASDAVTLITASTERYRIDSAGTNTWSNVGGAGTAMTLNSTGLGVGGSPSGNAPMVLVEGAAGTYAKFNSKVGAKTWSAGYRSGTLQYEIQEDGTERFVIANGGNVGIGVTPIERLTVAGTASVGGTGNIGVKFHSGSPVTGNLAWLLSNDSANSNILNLYYYNAGVFSGRAFVVNQSGNFMVRTPSTPPTIPDNEMMVFNLTSNTNLQISVKGTDGTVRTANITLA